MDAERFHQVETLYQAVVDLDPAARRRKLDEAPPEIRHEVEAMLAQKGSLLDKPAWENLSEVTESLAAVGESMGRYKIEARLGAGGMGVVFKALDTRLGRKVAIKTSQDRFSDRFEREARAISALNHPHICTLYDVGPNYLVMELVEGETLAGRLKLGALPLHQVLQYGAQIAEALAEAHANNIVHRDLKPANIMITRHGVKVLDFGLAKMLSEADLTASRAIMGTPAYMAPEQVEGRDPSCAGDLFALGLVLFQMTSGKLPFPGASLGQMLSSGSLGALPSLSQQRPDVPEGLDRVVRKLLAANPADRPQTASEVARALTDLAAPPASPRRTRLWAASAAAVLVLGVLSAWLFQRSEKRHWALESIPELTKLASSQPLAAFMLMRKVDEVLPGNPDVARFEQSATRRISIESTPAGAKVELQDYESPGSWLALGNTPLINVEVPNGYFRWRISKPGSEVFIAAPRTGAKMQFALAEQGASGGMVPVPGGEFAEMIDFAGWFQYPLPPFDIDRFEVTNAQYQQFIEQGGYRKPEYWKEKFLKDGKELTWEQAMALFKDQTGRPGPSAWEAGHFPEGQGSYPVSGVSWYEASAYAAFAGKSLPAIGEWYRAAQSDLATPRISQSNFNGKGPAQVGQYPGVGPFGAFDMSGNVREWCLNSIDGDRFILGGAWRTQTYQAFDPEALPPFDRSGLNGFRCVRNREPLAAAAVAPMVRRTRDFDKEKPVSDALFQAYRAIYAYDRRPVNPVSEGIVENTADWTKEKIIMDAGYESQRLTLYLFLPKHVHAPYQTILFFPSARAEFMPDSRHLGDLQFVDYVIKSGRAVAYPIYNGTYERRGSIGRPGSITSLNEVARQSKEVSRSVDYLVSRPDLDKDKLGYLGVSMGAAYGVIYTALEDRFKTVLFLDGGFFLTPAVPACDQVNFAPRLKKPLLMMNGRYDFTFSVDRAQNPMFRMIGTPGADKRHVIFDTPHDISQEKEALSKEVLTWLDKYLGFVN